MTVVKHPLLQESLIWSEGTFTTLSIESPHFLLSFVGELQRQIEEGNGRFIILRDGKEASISKQVAVITDPLSIKRDEKKETATYIKEISSRASEEQLQTLARINEEISELVENLSLTNDLPLDYEGEITIQNLLKALGMVIRIPNESFLLSLVSTLNAISHITKCKTFFICHLKDYLSSDELDVFVNEMIKSDIEVFLISGIDPRPSLKSEKRITIDRDLAEI